MGDYSHLTSILMPPSSEDVFKSAHLPLTSDVTLAPFTPSVYDVQVQVFLQALKLTTANVAATIKTNFFISITFKLIIINVYLTTAKLYFLL